MFETASWANVFLSPRRESKSYFSFNKLIFYKCNYKLIVSIAKIINEWGEGKIQGYYINIIYDSQIFSKNRSRYIIILLLLFSSFEKWNRLVGRINSAIIFSKSIDDLKFSKKIYKKYSNISLFFYAIFHCFKKFTFFRSKSFRANRILDKIEFFSRIPKRNILSFSLSKIFYFFIYDESLSIIYVK